MEGDRPFEGENKIAISSQTRGDTTILRPNGDHFGQLERRAPGGPFPQVHALKGELQEGPFLKQMLEPFLNVLLKLDFIRGMTDFL